MADAFARDSGLDNRSYILHGGSPGVARLKVLSAVMRPHTERLLKAAGVTAGRRCVDVGCGGGDVSLLMAEMVGVGGRIRGVDLDRVALDLATALATSEGWRHVEFRQGDACDLDAGDDNDVVYARFLLSHVPEPLRAIASMRAALAPGGTIVVEDTDFLGHFCFPPYAAFDDYVDLFQRTAIARGADPNMGRRLPRLLRDAGFVDVDVHVAQPVAIEGEAKTVNPLTLEAIASSVIKAGFATEARVAKLIEDLWRFARDSDTLMSIARVVQVRARKP